MRAVWWETITYGLEASGYFMISRLSLLFYLVMPITMGALANYLVPLQIGSNDTAFPRINNLAFVVLLPSMLFAVLSCLIDEGPGSGWTLKIWRSKILLDAKKTSPLFRNLLNYSLILLQTVKKFNPINYSYWSNLWNKSNTILNPYLITLDRNRFIIISLFASLINLYLYLIRDQRLLDLYNNNKILLYSIYTIYPRNLFKKQLNKFNVIKWYILSISNFNFNFKKKLKFNNSSYELLNKNKFLKPNKTPFNFNEYLVGLTDGNGIFNIYINSDKTKVIFKFKIALTIKNIQLLYYLKSQLKCGQVYINNNMASFNITNKEHLKNIILPIFDNYPLLTSKRFDYIKFKESILESYKTNTQNIENIINIKNKIKPENYISDAWLNINKTPASAGDPSVYGWSIQEYEIMSRSWIIGFIEIKDCFNYVNINKFIIIHNFNITQKVDKIILDNIKNKFKITTTSCPHPYSSSVKLKENNIYSLNITNNKNIKYIIDYLTFDDYSSLFKGIQSYKFNLWRRSYFKYKGNYKKLNKIRDRIRYLV